MECPCLRSLRKRTFSERLVDWRKKKLTVGIGRLLRVIFLLIPKSGTIHLASLQQLLRILACVELMCQAIVHLPNSQAFVRHQACLLEQILASALGKLTSSAAINIRSLHMDRQYVCSELWFFSVGSSIESSFHFLTKESRGWIPPDVALVAFCYTNHAFKGVVERCMCSYRSFSASLCIF